MMCRKYFSKTTSEGVDESPEGRRVTFLAYSECKCTVIGVEGLKSHEFSGKNIFLTFQRLSDFTINTLNLCPDTY